MSVKQTIRGMATVSFWAEDVKAATKWYTELLGIEPYFLRPNANEPEYVEFRIGDHQHELGLINKNYRPSGSPDAAGGVVLYWHVDDIDATLENVLAMGATAYEPLIKREAGFITAAVTDPFGNILGLMYNPHYLEMLRT